MATFPLQFPVQFGDAPPPPMSLLAVRPGTLTGWRTVLCRPLNPSEAPGAWLWNPDNPETWVWSRVTPPECRSAVVPLALLDTAAIKAAVQPVYWGAVPGSWRSSDGSVTVDPETQPFPTTDQTARDAAATALELANFKGALFETANPPANPTNSYTLKAGDVWWNSTYGESDTHYCPDVNCRGHVLDAAGNPRVGALIPHRGKWTHRWNGSAWKDGERNALIVANEIGADAVTAFHIRGREVTTDKLSAGAISDNLWPNANSEAAPPSGADLTTAEWAWRVSDGFAYAGAWRRYKNNTTGAQQQLDHAVPCSPGDAFHFEAQCVTTGAAPAGVWIEFRNSAGAVLGYTGSGAYSTTATGWTKVASAGTAPDTAVEVRFRLWVNGGGAAAWDAIYARRRVGGAVLDVASVAADTMTLGGVSLNSLIRKRMVTHTGGDTVSFDNIFAGTAEDPVADTDKVAFTVSPFYSEGSPPALAFVVIGQAYGVASNGNISFTVAAANTGTIIWEVTIIRVP